MKQSRFSPAVGVQHQTVQHSWSWQYDNTGFVSVAFASLADTLIPRQGSDDDAL